MVATPSTAFRLLCGAQWRTRAVRTAAVALVAATALAGLGLHVASAQAPQRAASPYHGVWFDDTGKGAVEIAPCNSSLCGRIVWLREPLDKAGKPLTDGYNPDPRLRLRPICGLPVIGNVKQQGSGTWDEGWIYDPKQGKQFDVELKLRSPDALQVMGYLGIKFLSETFIWKRAPADLKRCT